MPVGYFARCDNCGRMEPTQPGARGGLYLDGWFSIQKHFESRFDDETAVFCGPACIAAAFAKFAEHR